MRHAFYFGCIRETGHYLWDSHGNRLHDYHPLLTEVGFPVKPGVLDGGLMPYHKFYWRDGQAFLAHVNGWTIITFNDSGVDKRPGSHSVFVVRGEKPFDDALTVARKTFPQIFERFKFDIVPAQAEPRTSASATQTAK